MVIFDKLFGGLRTKRQSEAVFPELPEFANPQISAYALRHRLPGAAETKNATKK
jgi:hypothetical protein